MNQCPKISVGRYALLRHEPGISPSPAASFEPQTVLSAHWDLLVESVGQQLLSWRIDHLPNQPIRDGDPHFSAKCKRVTNHRELYLSYEGEISGNRGRVTQLASGLYRGYWSPDSSFRSLSQPKAVWGPFGWDEGNSGALCGSLLNESDVVDRPVFLWLELGLKELEQPAQTARMVLEMPEVDSVAHVAITRWSPRFSWLVRKYLQLDSTHSGDPGDGNEAP